LVAPTGSHLSSTVCAPWPGGSPCIASAATTQPDEDSRSCQPFFFSRGTQSWPSPAAGPALTAPGSDRRPEFFCLAHSAVLLVQCAEPPLLPRARARAGLHSQPRPALFFARPASNSVLGLPGHAYTFDMSHASAYNFPPTPRGGSARELSAFFTGLPHARASLALLPLFGLCAALSSS
jgi:hypothetical protein